MHFKYKVMVSLKGQMEYSILNLNSRY
jgi:hypothetical protein